MLVKTEYEGLSRDEILKKTAIEYMKILIPLWEEDIEFFESFDISLENILIAMLKTL